MNIENLLAEWQNIDTEEGKQTFISKAKENFRILPKEEKNKFAEDFFAAAEKEVSRGEKLLEEIEMRERLNHIIPFINISEISKKYFHKSANWLYQRINGYNVNGKPAKFSDEEKNVLRFALNDISKIMQDASSKI
ncbi:MAG: DUF5053 domain-containing protein [Prevotella sp.]|jgi:hypothetical protein|nr:DUF5053 domain-containing protein [Prevotella sp.]